jgi:hypothetical protein
VAWTSSNPSIAQVSAQGLVSALQTGDVTITAHTAQQQAQVLLRVKPPVALQVQSGGILELSLDETFQLQTQVINHANQQVHWVSNNPAVAQIDSQGLVTARGFGNATLTATAQADPGKSVPVKVSVGEATPGNLAGLVVENKAGAALEGSQLELYRGGVRVASTNSDPKGQFAFAGLNRGSYTLKAIKPGWAGSEVVGLPIKAGQTTRLELVQARAADPSATTQAPELKVLKADGSDLAGAHFKGSIVYRVKLDSTSAHVRPMRSIYVALARTPGSGALLNTETSSRALFAATEDTLVQELSGEAVAGLGSPEGSLLLLEVVAYDFNYNRSHYMVPITLQNQDPRIVHTVQAPTAVDAFAVTYSNGVGFFKTRTQAASRGTSLYSEIRWCYNQAAGFEPFAFDIERSSDGGNTYARIGRVGGGVRSECPAAPHLRPFYFRDHSAELEVGQSYQYRVVAIGANEATSPSSRTSPLPAFKPRLLAPGNEASGVSRTPTFVISHPQLEIGADGAAYGLSVADSHAGSGLQWNVLNGALLYVEEGTGTNGNQTAVGKSKAFYFNDAGQTTVLKDDAQNKIAFDTSTHQLSLPYNFDGLARSPSLQALRSYAWRQVAGFAYKYDGNRISAYSLHTAAAAFGMFPVSSEPTETFDFTTGQ